LQINVTGKTSREGAAIWESWIYL